MNPDKLCVNLFKGFDFTGVKVSIFPIGNWRRRYNSGELREASDVTQRSQSRGWRYNHG